MSSTVPDEILWRHIRGLPYFRAMLRAVEDSFYQRLEIPGPVLDVGCADAHFASVAFQRPLDVGLDPWSEPLREARSRKAYCLIVQSDGGQMPFADGRFASVISNSVLEHIPHVERVLKEIARVIRPGGWFVFCVPNHRFPQLLLGTQVFKKLDLPGAADWYSRFFNRISRHVHCNPPDVWQERLENTGFVIDRYWDYFPARALHVMETGHFFGVPALVSRKLTGRWILARNRFNLEIPYRLARRTIQSPISPEGAYTFYITHRSG
jgi:SAM-dependent methyltransferase